MNKFSVFSLSLAALFLASCATQRPGAEVELSSSFSEDITYANLTDNKLNNNMELWRPVTRMNRRNSLMRLGMKDMTFKRYFCATVLFGINEKGELVDVVQHNTFGDDKFARQAVETLKRSEWVPTESNPDRKPGIFVLELFNFRDNDPNAMGFKENCPFYITSEGVYIKSAVSISREDDQEEE